MNWKTSDVRKAIVWLLSFMEESDGKASMKRLLALILGLTTAYELLFMVRNHPTIEWTNAIGFTITILTFIGSLLALGTIPWQTKKDEQK
jgi:hypothetical protein